MDVYQNGLLVVLNASGTKHDLIHNHTSLETSLSLVLEVLVSHSQSLLSVADLDVVHLELAKFHHCKLVHHVMILCCSILNG